MLCLNNCYDWGEFDYYLNIFDSIPKCINTSRDIDNHHQQQQSRTNSEQLQD
jgi:hypothetical protein